MHATQFVSASGLVELREKNKKLETEAKDLAARLLEMEGEQAAAQVRALTMEIAALERERVVVRELAEKEKELAALLGKVGFLERRMAEGPWGGGGRFDIIVKNLRTCWIRAEQAS